MSEFTFKDYSKLILAVLSITISSISLGYSIADLADNKSLRE
jgi:hypothetical protein